jgi:hypothetical protein
MTGSSSTSDRQKQIAIVDRRHIQENLIYGTAVDYTHGYCIKRVAGCDTGRYSAVGIK